MAHLQILVLFLTLLQYGGSYRTDIRDEDAEAYCKYRKHLTLKPTATCCAGTAVKPGIEMDTFWPSCSDSLGPADTLEAAAWNIYECILKRATGGGGSGEISLQEFSDLMTANYPEDIKTKIDEEIKTMPSLTATLTDSESLEKIRVTYYDIEMEVCNGMPSERKSYGNVETCSTSKEENHRAGFCCKRSFPVDIRHNSMLDVESHSRTLPDGPNHRYLCNGLFNKALKDLNGTEEMHGILADMCSIVCALGAEGKMADFDPAVVDNKEYWNLDLDAIMKKPLLPPYIPASLAAEAKEYARSQFSLNDTIDAIRDFEFPDTRDGDSNTLRSVHFITYAKRGNYSAGENYKSEFIRRRFHKQILHIPVICSTYRKLVGEMERYIFQDCAPEERHDTTVEVPEVTEPPPTATEPEQEPEAEPESEPEAEPESTPEPEESPNTESSGPGQEETTPAAAEE